MHIALFTDATSREKEIGEKSMVLIKESLDKLGYTYKTIQRPTQKNEFLQTYQTFDLGIPVIHGGYGEGGHISALLELLGLPYLFSDHDVHALCFNKYVTNLVVESYGATIPLTHYCKSLDDLSDVGFSGPYFVKPTTSGSSLDCGKFATIDAAAGLVQKICTYDSALLQQAITGRELTVSIRGNQHPKILGIMEIITQKEFADYDAKYNRDQTKEIFPDLDRTLKEQIEAISLTIYKKLGLSDLARIDFLLADKLYFLEVNTIPGMTPRSFVPQCVKQYGYAGFELFLDELITNNLSVKK